VLQEVLVAPNRSVLDNIFLGFDGLFRRRIPREARRLLAAEALARITRTRLDFNSPVGALPLAQQQLIVIARALVRDPSILILDEVTSALDIEDRESLFACIRQFVSSGRLVIFISHRIDEVLGLSDEITILRNGASVATVPAAGLDAAQLLDLVCRIEPLPECEVEP
jgi:ribose transport system ATP-binding protein